VSSEMRGHPRLGKVTDSKPIPFVYQSSLVYSEGISSSHGAASATLLDLADSGSSTALGAGSWPVSVGLHRVACVLIEGKFHK
jgi:hypothetical protein